MKKNKLILISDIQKNEIKKIFSSTNKLKKIKNKTAVFLFLEPSTRTKLSFELACHKLGLSVLHFNSNSSSLKKGENLEQTLRAISAMQPDLLIIRHGKELAMDKLYQLGVPIISAGSSDDSHPTQALLDLFTLKKENLINKNKKLLFLGDISINRVAKSHQMLLKDWGFKMAYCCPTDCRLNKTTEQIKYFKDKATALNWADIVMVLRLQKERKKFSKLFLNKYKKNYQLTLQDINKNKNIKLMHPGPYVEGLDLEAKLADDKNSLIYKQVKNSVLVRSAIIQNLLT